MWLNITLQWLYLTLHYSTMDLLHCPWFYIIVPGFDFTLLDSTLLFIGYLTLLESTAFYQSSSSLYLTLHHSTRGLLHSTWFYVTLQWLYLTVRHSTIVLLHFTWLYITLPWLYFTVLDFTLLYVYHGSTSLFLTLHYSLMVLLHSTAFYHSWFCYCTMVQLHSSFDSIHYSSLATSLCLNLLPSTRALLHSSWLHITLPGLYFTLLDFTLLCDGSTSLYLMPGNEASSTHASKACTTCSTI